jgi:hypothetical protein
MRCHWGWLFPEFYRINQKNYIGFELKATTRLETYYSILPDVKVYYLSMQVLGFGFCLSILWRKSVFPQVLPPSDR